VVDYVGFEAGGEGGCGGEGWSAFHAGGWWES